MSEQYRELPPLVDEALVARAMRFGTAELCDGMTSLGILPDGCMDAAIMPIDEGLKMVGTASTVETADGDNFPIHVAIYQNRPGYVLVIDGKGCMDRAYLGDLMAGAAKAIGLNGIVVDGCVRDKVGLKELGLPIYARGFMQRSPSKKGPGTINSPILCAGVRVNPGDLVVGDHDGVTVIPRDSIEAVLDAAEKKTEYEQKRRMAIAEYERCRLCGEPLPNLAPAWVLAMLKA
ncbi:MAG: RraA family protein [Sphaerochaeta sp.]|jgi:RraA family protein|uniref:RraA family protein n=1 Tax=Sphaerochaeta sp. TaxID=1972642 RepID=UPI002FC68E3B